MNGIVIYKSKYGATHQYAQWIGKELKLPVFTTREIDEEKLDRYDFVILGSSVYLGKMLIKKWLKNNVHVLLKKKIFLFVVCGTPADKTDKLDSYIAASVPAEIRTNCDIYFLPGKMILKKLSFFDWLLIKIAAKGAKSNGAKEQMRTGYNDVKKENIAGLLNTIRNSSIVQSYIESEPIPSIFML